ncbi:F0F1 ATP synthase subunit B [Granulosicoccus antarcticus]|uniref:ATP synthase subunit b n=1 Tax=Granulosicoccus antarcticus IMCC3135 TaxID=1192854 RepID=A0A2Z2NZK5_9GAMM|nr:F0F1 ATP synthase subunit B [Granulosicoccus antarcticus]ASJ76872.1 ATP synthase subunit b [Granulosicoccus antarcticus IMCC3135]
MNLNLTLLGQAISFAVFVLFCMKYVWPPIINGLRERQAMIAGGLADAEKGSQKREEAEAEIAVLLQDAKAQAAEIVAQAHKRGSEMVETSKDAARSEGERLKQSAQTEIDLEVVSVKEGLRKQVGLLAVEGARRILGSEVDQNKHNAVIDDLVKQI